MFPLNRFWPWKSPVFLRIFLYAHSGLRSNAYRPISVISPNDPPRHSRKQFGWVVGYDYEALLDAIQRK
jgi:hypothetical protein